ncbi:MAG: hypothetical protein U5R31_16585 [Acidimicrobiia bacterium]|nr:hypothetical protein [Acidimicrobiia bacterium]
MRKGALQACVATAVLHAMAFACTYDEGNPTGTTTSAPDDVAERSTLPPITSTTGTQPGSEPPTTSAGDEARPPGHQEILDGYVAYWDARFAANTGTPNPHDPALAEHATGAQLDAVVAETRANLEAGLVFDERHDPADFQEVTVVSVEGDVAEVQECVVDDGLVIDTHTGEVVDDEVSTAQRAGELRRVEGRWRVAATSIIQSWEGVAGCALGS